MMDQELEEAARRIAGQVVLSGNPGATLKDWRTKLDVKQNKLAEEMKVSPSVLSDYESGRRPSPGVGFVRRYVESLVSVDSSGKRLMDKYLQLTDISAILSIGEFKKPAKAGDVMKRLRGTVLEGENHLDSPIYGYTLLDSIRAIYAMSGFDFYRIFGTSTERALVFTKVGLGRSPLVAIRVSPLKPRMVVLHGPQSVDELAVQLAKRERIILILSGLNSEEELARKLSEL